MFFCIFCLAGGLMEGANEELSSTANDEKMAMLARGRIASPYTMGDAGLSMGAANVQRSKCTAIQSAVDSLAGFLFEDSVLMMNGVVEEAVRTLRRTWESKAGRESRDDS